MQVSRHQRFVRRASATVWFVLLAASAAAGCSGTSNPSTESDPKTKPKATADEVLQAMIEAYQNAESYQDRGRLRLAYRAGGERHEDIAPLSLQITRPNRFRLQAYQAEVAADGALLRAKILDDASNNIDEQFVERPLTEPATLDSIYDDTVVADLINRGLGRQPITLELMLSEKPLEAFLAEEVGRSLLGPKSLDDRRCHRVKISAAEGEFVLWVDEEDYRLHRMEYPTDSLRERLQAEGDAQDVSLTAEFFDAKFAAPPESRFQLAQPDGAKIVRRFVPPPQPLPTDLFGRVADPFAFADLNTGEALDSKDWRGKIAVLLWFSDHPAGRQAAQQFDRIRAANKSKDTEFLLVCTEPSQRQDEEIKSLVDQWKCSTRIVRDLKAVGRDVFGIDLLPTLVVLDGRGVVHVFDEGFNPGLSTELPAVLDMLRRGENVSAAVIQQAENERLRYQRSLTEEGVDLEAALEATSPTRDFPKRTRPFECRLTEVWSTEKLKAPGNMLLVERDGEASLLVNEGWRSVANIDPATGEVRQLHELDLPTGASVSRLSTSRGKLAGQAILATDILARQVHVFDPQWKKLFSYPPETEKHAGIRDAQLEDLNDDGDWQVSVGFWELLGVHGVDAKGKRLWSDRACGSVQTIALTPPNPVGWRRWVISGDTGRIHSLNHHGNADPPVRPDGGVVDQIFTAEFAGGESVYCAVAESQSGKRTVRGLDEQFKDVWSYDNLPAGVYASRVQFVTSGKLRIGGKPMGVWVLAGADGSVHLISHDGAFNDMFFTGGDIRGLGWIQREGKTLLVLSSQGRVAAYAIEAQ